MNIYFIGLHSHYDLECIRSHQSMWCLRLLLISFSFNCIRSRVNQITNIASFCWSKWGNFSQLITINSMYISSNLIIHVLIVIKQNLQYILCWLSPCVLTLQACKKIEFLFMSPV